MMPEPDTNCPYGDESDIDARYLAGTLSPAESAVFEEHYFSCDKCFAKIQRGNEISAALGAPSASASSRRSAPIPLARARTRFATWRPALAAAALVIVAFGIRQVARSRDSVQTASPDSVAGASRGGLPRLSLETRATAKTIVAIWSSIPAARSYRVRLLGPDGSLLFSGETADTSITLSRDLLSGAADNSIAYWDIQALDGLRSVVASSPPVQAQTSAGPP
jgi:hypothetical protein